MKRRSVTSGERTRSSNNYSEGDWLAALAARDMELVTDVSDDDDRRGEAALRSRIRWMNENP
jgi:hypothetical protein